MSKDFWKSLWMKYCHLLPVLIYMIFYMSVFAYVENRPNHHIHLLGNGYDDLIPFCEYFIVPYYLWFLYITMGVLFFALVEKDRNQYYSLITNLCIGMTLFLIISLVWPNGHTLRPASFEKDTIFTRMVQGLYRIDTSTNIFPSIHVFNSVAVHSAISRCDYLKKNHRWLIHGSFVLCILIIASTLFLKQHTIIDVVTALLLNFTTYCLVYSPEATAHHQHSQYRNWHN
ncbi:MAG: phosphatase PAP2 family protein [Eubacteriales bacterium]|nr:phosphatase PAP2 family protein [Eubacteriales bacterium]